MVDVTAIKDSNRMALGLGVEQNSYQCKGQLVHREFIRDRSVKVKVHSYFDVWGS